MKDLGDDEQLEVSFERGKRVEFVYDEPEKEEPRALQEGQEVNPPETARMRKKMRMKAAAILVAAAFCAVAVGIFLWIHGTEERQEGSADTQADGTEAPDGESAEQAVPLSDDYEAHLERLKSYLSNQYIGGSTLEITENGEYSYGEGRGIMIADLDGDGARPEAIILTEYVVDAQALASSQVSTSLVIVYFDLSDEIQSCSTRISDTDRQTKSLLLNMQGDGTAQLIFYRESTSDADSCSWLYEYISSDTPILRCLGTVSGKIAARYIQREDGDVDIRYDLDGVYQVKETVSGNNGYEDYAYERVCSYVLDRSAAAFVPVLMDGRGDYDYLYGITGDDVEAGGEGILNADRFLQYYELENTSWWYMRRPLLAVREAVYLTEYDLNISERETLYGTAAHLVGGFVDTNLYLVETDYGDRGIILLDALDDLDICMAGMQGLPFFEVFALEEPEELSEELYGYLDLHITSPGYYDIENTNYVWIDLNGDGVERRFAVSCTDDSVVIGNGFIDDEGLTPFYIDASGGTARYLTVTDLDPDDHRLEIGVSEFAVPSGADGYSERAFTVLFQSLDGIHLAEISKPQCAYWSWQWFYFTPFDPVSGEANYADGHVWLEYASAPGYTVEAVYDGLSFTVSDDTVAVFTEAVPAAISSAGVLVHRAEALDAEADVYLPEGTEAVVDGVMMKNAGEVQTYWGDMFLYRAHLIVGGETYYTDYMTLVALEQLLGNGDMIVIPYQE